MKFSLGISSEISNFRREISNPGVSTFHPKYNYKFPVECLGAEVITKVVMQGQARPTCYGSLA